MVLIRESSLKQAINNNSSGSSANNPGFFILRLMERIAAGSIPANTPLVKEIRPG
jgi:hypothetical protein